MNIDLKPIAESKVRQLGGDVCGVLVRTEDGTIMAVSEDGRCTRLDAAVMGPVNSAREDALDCALSGQSYTKRLIQSVIDELNAMAFDLKESHTVNGQWPPGEQDTAMKVDHLRRMAAELRKLDILPKQAARAQGEIQVPNEQGKNRYGLDMAYFRALFNREINRPLVDFRPDELARVLARAARTADAAVLQEPEFQAARAETGSGEACRCVGPGNGCCCDRCDDTYPPTASQVPEGFEVLRRPDGIIITRLSDGGCAFYEKGSRLVTHLMAYHFLDALLTTSPGNGEADDCCCGETEEAWRLCPQHGPQPPVKGGNLS